MNKKYIYNYQQADFFIKQNVKCLGVGKHIKTEKIYFIFDYNECQNAYTKWNKQKNK